MKILLIAFLQLVFATAFCQQFQIAGSIVDESRTPIASVTIHDKQKVIKAMTNAKGNFLVKAHQNDTLYFTRLGYSKFMYKVCASGLVDVELKEESCLVTNTSTDFINFSGSSSFSSKLIKEKLTGEIIPEIKDSSDLYEHSDYAIAVQIGPTLKGRINDFADSIESVKGKGNGNIKLKFLVTKTGKIEQVIILKSFLQNVDEKIIQNLLTKFKALAAEEKGRKVDAYCELELEIKKDNGSIAIEVHKFK